MFGLMLIFIGGFIAIVLAIIGIGAFVSRKSSEPRRSAVARLNELEKDIEFLKGANR